MKSSMVGRIRELFREQGFRGVLSGGKRFLYWKALTFDKQIFKFIDLLGQNYHTGFTDDIEIKFYYTQETFISTLDLLENNTVGSEQVPLSILKSGRPIDTVIDVGGHFGIYSVLLQKLNPESELYVFEPNKQNREVLVEVLNANAVNAFVSDAVVSGNSGSVEFYKDPKKGSERNSTTPNDSFVKVEKPSVALSDLISQNDIESAFVKIDAEGEEVAIMENLLTSNISYLEGIVEIHPDKIDIPKEDFVKKIKSECDVFGFVCETSPGYKFVVG